MKTPLFARFAVLPMIAIAIGSSSPVSAQTKGSAPVTVVNDAASPVPVSGVVTVSGTSSVTLTNNTETTPVFVQNVGAPAHVPYQETVHGQCGVNFCTFRFPIPAAGQRLVVQHISASTIVPQGNLVSVEVTVSPAAPTFQNLKRFLVNARLQFHAGVIGNNDQFVTNEPILLYVDPTDTQLVVETISSGTIASTDQYVTLTGYLVNQ